MGIDNCFRLLLLVLYFNLKARSVKCMAGYGQIGKLRSDGYEWPQDCKFQPFCWQARTTDITRVQKLFDFPWQDYYRVFYVKGCSGDFGTTLKIDPWAKKPRPKVVMINITTPLDINGVGGSEPLELMYVCKKNFCSGASISAVVPTLTNTIILSAILAIIFSGV